MKGCITRYPQLYYLAFPTCNNHNFGVEDMVNKKIAIRIRKIAFWEVYVKKRIVLFVIQSEGIYGVIIYMGTTAPTQKVTVIFNVHVLQCLSLVFMTECGSKLRAQDFISYKTIVIFNKLGITSA